MCFSPECQTEHLDTRRRAWQHKKKTDLAVRWREVLSFTTYHNTARIIGS